MNIQFLGAARTVTGSMHLVSVNGTKILLDCGMFQGKRAESYEKNRNFAFDPASIDAVILSHSHIDHAGNLPNLVKNGYRGPIYATSATRDLCNIMLYDSAYIQMRDVEFVNKRRQKKHESLVQPLYDVMDVTAAMSQFIGINYNQQIQVADGVNLKFLDAGHILGSAVTVLEVEEKGNRRNIGFTGDLGRKNAPIIRDPQPIGSVDVLISESTYGGKLHDPVTGMKDSLCNVLRQTSDRGGKVIVPSFSVGRTQEIVYLLSELFDEGRLPVVPIYVDSPLAVNASDIFRMHTECFDQETLNHLHANEDPFGFNRLTYVRSVDESKKLNEMHSPCVIISASGMCEGGRIVHHLANNIENPNNTVLIVGYQAQHTLGRRIVEKQPEVSIFGEVHKLNAEVVVLNSFSAHAGQDELVEYIQSADQSRLKKLFLVHGEIEQIDKLSAKLKDSHATEEICIPRSGEKFEV
ncbi:MAG: MBL fold metallo-hydrolase [Ignavibacteriae bacterium]|nr:MAG: MBL fold metallo-hydrolase [Ignavibacteriota bacterium]